METSSWVRFAAISATIPLPPGARKWMRSPSDQEPSKYDPAMKGAVHCV